MLREQLRTAFFDAQSLPANYHACLRSYVKQAPPDGLIMEFGVYGGDTLRALAGGTTRMVYGFDSFEGLPEAWNNLPVGQFKTEIPKFTEPNIELVVGWYADTVPAFAASHPDPVALVHIDCDLYQSAKCVFDHFHARFQNGTIIVFDEFIGYTGWEEHEFKAFAEMLETTGYGWECFARHGGEQCAFRLSM